MRTLSQYNILCLRSIVWLSHKYREYNFARNKNFGFFSVSSVARRPFRQYHSSKSIRLYKNYNFLLSLRSFECKLKWYFQIYIWRRDSFRLLSMWIMKLRVRKQTKFVVVGSKSFVVDFLLHLLWFALRAKNKRNELKEEIETTNELKS